MADLNDRKEEGMGERGPVPLRTDELMGHKTKAELDEREAAKAPGAAIVHIPLPDPTWHPIALRWYESLAESGQHQFFEPSDWATAQYVAEMMHRHLGASQLGAQMFASIMAAASELLSTEGSRRRLRLELQRPDSASTEMSASVAAIQDYRARITG